MHLIDRGRVAVRVTTPLGDVATLNVRGVGDVVGELALLDPTSRRTASVVALEPSETLALHRDEFDDLRRLHPSVDRFLVAILALEVQRLSSLLAEALYIPVDTRVLRRVLALADLYAEEGSDRVEIPFTQEEIGSIAGTSRATVNRVLGEAEVDGSLQVKRGRVIVIDRQRLERRAR